MSITFDFDNMMYARIGKNGITEKEMSAHAKEVKNAYETVEKGRGVGMQGWMSAIYGNEAEVARIKSTAARLQSQFDTFVVLGIGGSALGPIAVHTALKHLYYNELPKSVRKTPRFYVLDNVDPEKMNALFDVIDLKSTVFNVVTKSGATSETMSQYLIINDMLKRKYGKFARDHIIATTSEKKGNLIELAKEEGYETFFIPEGVGGRFSELSAVGLLPAAVTGIDVEKLLEGARFMDERCKNMSLADNPALCAALLMYLSMQKGRNISVMMPYADSLRYVADWYAQLWAESLGKATDNDGKKVHCGQTPVKALGVTDQHSQVQLYMEGPEDKVVTFLEVKNFRSDIKIPEGCPKNPDVHFLCGHTLAELNNTELYATRFALTKNRRPNFTVTMDTVDEFHLGALLYFFQMQTAYAGALLNINAYDQPGVEEGKNATYALFGRQGYEEKAKELAAAKYGGER